MRHIIQEHKLRVCIACSPGGHLVEAKQLTQAYEKYEHFYFTFSGPMARDLARKARVRSIPNIVRYNPLTWISGAILSAYIAFVEKPDIIISTGAGVVVFFCIFSKLFGAKIVFIESMAAVTKPTLTSKFLYPFADLFIVQWPDLIKNFPRAKYFGRLL
jgi:beta-1,4-N-acetylglucosaminyltransferase